MPCARCNGILAKERFHDTIDESGVLRPGVWRWASWYAECRNMVDDRVAGSPALASRPNKHINPISETTGPRTNPAPTGMFMMF